MRGALAGAALALAAAGAHGEGGLGEACTKHWIATEERRSGERGRAAALGVTKGEYEAYLTEQEALAREALKEALAGEHRDEGMAMHGLLTGAEAIRHRMKTMRARSADDAAERARALEALGQALEAVEAVQDALARTACNALDGRGRQEGADR